MTLDFDLSRNPYVTTQEKGINWNTRRVYEKEEVAAMKNEYRARIMQYMRAYKLKTPCFRGPVALEVVFSFKTADRRLWGCLKETKPDADNAIKGLQDVLGELGFFHGGDQQVADLHVIKLWASNARVKITIKEVRRDIFRT